MQLKLVAFGAAFVAIWGVILVLFFLQSQAPMETVTGLVIGRDFYSESMGPEEGSNTYTRVFVRDDQSALWVLRIEGSLQFVAGERYTFQVRLWPSGSYSDPPVTQETTIYPIEDYNPKVASTPFTLNPMFLLFLLLGPGMFLLQWVVRSRRRAHVPS